MKNAIISILVILLLGGVVLYALEQNKEPELSVTVIQPAGGENYTYGERFRFVVQTNVDIPGTMTTYLTGSNSQENWEENIIQKLVSEEKQDFTVNEFFRGSFRLGLEIDVTNVNPGTYFLLAVWEDTNKTQQILDFSASEFTISEQ
ncbi:MAG: hypothetical protein ACI9BF_000115 [Candidatus Paceibacteria bacterium]|jgi:hypothetical protein